MRRAVGHHDPARFIGNDQHQRQPVGQILIGEYRIAILALRGSDKGMISGDRKKSVRFPTMMGNEYCRTGLAQVSKSPRKLGSPDKNFLHPAPPRGS
ncbi:MAG: hypothetical protein ACTHJR_07800 [Sphingomonas sp.]